MRSAIEGRRERKKRQTRDALALASRRLFAEHGYQATTIADVAHEAGVSPRTFFSYFPSKEAVLFAPVEGVIADIEHELEHGDGPAFDILRSWVVDHEPWFTQELPALHVLLDRVVCEDDGIAIAALGFVERAAMAIAHKLRVELGSDPNDTLPEMAALSTIVAFAAAMPGRTRERSPGAVEAAGTRVLADLDRAITFAQAGIAATLPPRP